MLTDLQFIPGVLLTASMLVVLRMSKNGGQLPCWFYYFLSSLIFYSCKSAALSMWPGTILVALSLLLCGRQLLVQPGNHTFVFRLLKILLSLRCVTLTLSLLPGMFAIPMVVLGLVVDTALATSLLLQQELVRNISSAPEPEIVEDTTQEEPGTTMMLGALRDRAELFSKVFELVPDVLVICRYEDGRYIAVNRQWSEMTGYSRAEALGKTALDFNLWVDLRQRDAMLAAIAKDGVAHNCEAELRHRNGRIRYNRISGMRFESGGESLVMYVVQNVTALREAEHLGLQVSAQLRDREKRYTQIFDLVPDAISITDMRTSCLVEVNHHWEKLTGCSRDMALGKRAHEDLHIWVHPEKREVLMQLLRERSEVIGFEILLRDRNGKVVFGEAFCCVFESENVHYMLSVVRDVTQQVENEIARKRAEISLRQSEHQMRAVLAAMREGIVVLDRHAQILICNGAAEDILGLRKKRLAKIFTEDEFRFMREDGSYLQHEQLPIWQTLADGSSHSNLVLGIQRKGRELRWVYLSSDPIYSEFDPARVENVVLLLVDITELKQTAAKLREREQVFASVFQVVPDTLTITRMSDGCYVDVNRNWEPTSGYTREEVLGRSSLEINLWVDDAERTALVQEILQHGEVRDKLIRFRHKTGRVGTCRVSASMFSNNGESYLLLTSRNIEQELALEEARQLAEFKLRENEYKYSSIFQLSPIPLGLVDMTTGIVLEVNDVWLKQFGYQREEVVGKTSASLHFWADETQRAAMLKELAETGQVERLEMQHRRKDGQALTCLLSTRLFDLSAGRVYIFSLVDVTRQLQVEHEIRELAAELEQRVERRTQNLEQANRELADTLSTLKRAQDKLVHSEKMAALGSLVAGVAHELNTPIGNSVTVASTLQDKTRELLRDIGDGKLRRSVLDHYLQSAEIGTALLLKTLNVAKELISNFKQVAVDQSSSQRREFDLQMVILEMVSTLTPMYKKTPYVLNTELASGIRMDSYPGILGQVLTNFMTNALAHAFEGREHGVMKISSRLLNATHVEFSFEDDGVGISEADQKHVFDPFFTTKLGQGGSGLGMNIVYNLVTGVLGGEIHLHSQLGVGTCFTVVLPLVAPQLRAE